MRSVIRAVLRGSKDSEKALRWRPKEHWLPAGLKEGRGERKAEGGGAPDRSAVRHEGRSSTQPLLTFR